MRFSVFKGSITYREEKHFRWTSSELRGVEQARQMIGKPVALIQIPNQRLFGVAQAAQYLGKHANTVRKLADLGKIQAWVEVDGSGRRHRVFTLEDLNAYIDSLSGWYDSPKGERPGARREAENGYL